MGPVIYTITTRVWQLTVINLMSLVLTCLGLVVLGFAPAMMACLWAVARMDELTPGQLARGMWREYRSEFATANLVVLPAILVAIACLILAVLLPVLALVALIPLAWLSAGYALAALYVISRLSGTATDAFLNAQVGFKQAPFRHLMPVLLVPIILWIAYQQPLLALYFGLSAPMYFTHNVLAGALASAMPTGREILQ